MRHRTAWAMRASGYERVEADWYVEPRWLVDALLDVEPFEGVTWDPACGGGTIPRAVADRGIEALATDIADRGFGVSGVDFLQSQRQVANIVSNPPYGIIQPWIERALTMTTHKVAILARLALLEGQARRTTLFAKTPPARVWVSSRRPSMPPGGTDVPARGGTIAYGWFVWDRGHSGPTTLGWLA